MPRQEADDLRQVVTEVELAFAQTMADRDFEAFEQFVSEEAVFFSETGPLRGKTTSPQGLEAIF